MIPIIKAKALIWTTVVSATSRTMANLIQQLSLGFFSIQVLEEALQVWGLT